MMTGVVPSIIDTASSACATAPELRVAHDRMFERAEDSQGDIYGSADNWSVIRRSGHFRRMELLAAAALPDVESKVAVDFGTGPWGFAAMFPRLRAAARCISMDVSLRALQLAAARDVDILDKITYLTSDGESIPLDDDSVDIFWAGEVIEHTRQPSRFMQEVARVCRDGARVFLSTPNKRAIYYLARGEDYAIGPEHIALMDYETLDACVRDFLDPISIAGYETSLCPDLDAVIQDEAVAALAQERAYHHARSASGLIVDGFVRKALYRQNRRRWELDERLWSDPDVIGAEFCDALRMFEEIDGAGLPLGGSLDVPVVGNRLRLLFWAHDWSGHAEIEVAGDRRTVDLYSPAGGFRCIELPLSSAGKHCVRITRIGTKCAAAVSDQVIFYKAMGYTVTSGHF